MVSSLKNLCRIPALVVISNHPDIKEEIFSFPLRLIGKNFFFFNSLLEPDFEFNHWVESLQSKVFSLLKDQSVPEGTIPWDLLPFIGIEMLKWAKHLQKEFNLPVELSKYFIKSSFFTSRGKIDEEKAAKELLKEPSLTVSLQYKIACYYFLLDIALPLWYELLKLDPKFIKDFSESPVILWTKFFEETENPAMSNFEIYSVTHDFIAKVFYYGFNNGNLSAIKLVIDVVESSDKLKEIEESIGGIAFERTVNRIHDYFEKCYSPRELLLERDFLIHYDIATYLVNFSETEIERESILQRFKLVFGLLKGCLMWPYQDLFMKTAISVFNNLSEIHFYLLMYYIVDMTKDENLNHTYNYHHLLREFWIKSSLHLKKYTIKLETLRDPLYYTYDFLMEDLYLLQKIMTLNNFSHDDEINFRLILESASTEEKEDILERQGESTVWDLIFKNQFKEIDMYLNVLNMDEYSRKIFKEKVKIRFFRTLAITPMRLDLADKFVNWIVNPHEVDNLKKKLFRDYFKFSAVAVSVLNCEIPVTYLTELFEWFGKTDEQIKEWKINAVFDKKLSDEFFRYPENTLVNQFEIFFEWLGYTEIKIFTIKSYILEVSFSKAMFRLESRSEAKLLYKIILYLCSYDMQRVSVYVQKWKTRIKFTKNRKVCVVCGRSNQDHIKNKSRAKKCSFRLQNTKRFLANVTEICYEQSVKA